MLAAAPSWSVLAELAKHAAAAVGADVLSAAGRRGGSSEGAPSAQSLLRTFGASPAEVRVTLYRDTHAWCPYCHKVWLQLEEKRVPYRTVKINMNCYGPKKQEFLRMTGGAGMLPVVEIDGRVITESSVIMQELEATFPDYVPLLPPRGSPARKTTDTQMSMERDLFGCWLRWLRAEESPRARKSFEQAMDKTDAMLASAGGSYFGGAQVSLMDCVFASSLERISASILYYKGLQVKGAGRWKHVDSWFSAMESRPTYRATQSDYHTHVHDLPPQIGGCLASGTPEQIAAAASIDGTDGISWRLPLQPDSLEPAPLGVDEPEADRAEAALALIRHHENIVSSSAAATGADPGAADAAFRAAVATLLHHGGDPATTASAAASDEDGDASGAAAAGALRYTRDRICCPRDMGLGAARQLRAHLNYVADAIDPEALAPAVAIPTRNRKDVDPTRFGTQSMAQM